jgi:probable rRNA maturation factor
MDSAEQDRNMDIQIAVNFEAIDMPMSRLRELVATVCNCFAADAGPDTRYEISIAIVDDAEIRKLNTRFLDHRTTTDCLSFDLSDAGGESRIFELVVNGEMAVRQANLRGHSSEAELALYITHGLLHNLGFDDLTPSLSRKMHETEDEILQQLGYGFVYNRNTRTPEH